MKRAEEQAEEYGHSYQRELHYLLVHGIMHCLGYDHLTDEERRRCASGRSLFSQNSAFRGKIESVRKEGGGASAVLPAVE